MPSLTNDEYTIKINTTANTAGATEAKDALQGVQTKSKEVADQAKTTGGMFSGMVGQFALGNIVANGVINAFSGVKDQLKDAFSLAEQQQNVTAQLNNSLKGTKDASGMTIEGLQGIAENSQKTTTFSKLEVEQAEQIGLTYTNIGKKVFPDTMTAAENLSTRFGVALPNATKLLGRALEDPAKGLNTLSRYIGVLSPQLQQQVKDMEASGNVTGAQTILLGALNEKMGGAATTAAQTFSGQMAQLKNKVEDLKISIGEHLMAGLKDAFNWFEKNRQTIKEVAMVLVPLAGAILIVVAAFKTFEMVKNIIQSVKMAWMGFQMLMETNPIVLIITAIIAVGLLLVTHWQMVKKVAEDVFKAIGGFISDVWNWVKDHWPMLLAILTGPIGIAVLLIKDHFNQILSFFRGLPGDILHAIGDVSNLLFNVGKDIINGLINGVKNMAGKAADAVKDVGKGITNAAKSVLKIFSPSQVFHDIGINVGQGLTNGINSMQAPVAAASASLANTTISSANNQINSVTNNNVSSQTSIGNLNLSGASGVNQILQILNQNSLMTSKGLTPIGSSI